MQPEELTELLDDDLEMWAQGGTRILPKSQLERPKPDSVAPVAYPSVFPPAPPAVTSGTSAPVWAAVIGMAAVFFFAAIGGGIFYALHRSASETTESVASQSIAVATTSEPEQVTLTTTSDPIAVTTPVVITTTTTATTSAPQKITPFVAAPPPLVRYGTIQTFAAGAGKPVFLDGKQIGTGGSHLKAACGKHSISVGAGKARTYDVPCTGSTAITVGTPDGA
jgi:hypothetical protein